MGGGVDVMKRIPRIRFPNRHATKSSSSSSSSSTSTSDVPPPPSNTAVGGKASLQPKRTPVSSKEIEAILLGGCI